MPSNLHCRDSRDKDRCQECDFLVYACFGVGATHQEAKRALDQLTAEDRRKLVQFCASLALGNGPYLTILSDIL